jgi:uncharacterized protein YciI
MSESTQFAYVIKPSRLEMLSAGPTPEEERIVAEHFAYLKDLTENGIAILAGRTVTADARTFGIVVFNAISEEEAREHMESDPAVKQGVMKAELYPFRVALMNLQG